MTVSPDTGRDYMTVFEDLEWLLAQGVHPSRACRQVGYANVNSLCRLYYRAHRTVPQQLLIETSWCKRRSIA